MASYEDHLPRKRPEKGLGGFHWVDEEFGAEYPAVYNLLAASRLDGEERVGASITLFADTGELKCVICDRETEQALFLSLDAGKGLWEQLEAFVRGHSHAWRPSKRADG